MPVSKLKTLALLILLLANAILICILVPNRIDEQQEGERARQSLQTLCARHSITIDPQIIPDTVTLYALELSEDNRTSLQAATALLGEQVLVQDDSTRYLSLYSSQKGSCRIGRSGTFQATLTGSEPARDPDRSTRQTLKAMGFQVHTLSEPQIQSDGSRVMAASQAILGIPVFSDGLALTWTGDQLTQLDGVFYTGAMTRVSDSPCLSAADALVAFLSVRFDLGWVGSAITAMEQGYLRAETAAAAVVRLTPVWRLDTDTGSFYIDGISGHVSVAP